MNGYTSSWEHYVDELQWLDLNIQMLMQMQLETQPLDDAPADPFKGLIVSEQEVYSLLQSGQEAYIASEEVQHMWEQMQVLQEQIEYRVGQSRQAGVVLPLAYLADAFGLTPFEQKCLFIALAVELDRKYEKLYAYLQDDVTCKIPTIDLALKLLGNSAAERLVARQVFAPGGKLFSYFFKSDGNQERKQSLLSTPLVLDERMVRYLLHQSRIDESIEHLVEVWHPTEDLTPLLWDEQMQEQLQSFVERQDEVKNVFLITGSAGSGKKLHVRHVCKQAGKAVVLVDLKRLMQEKPEGRAAFDRFVREAILHDAVLCFHHLHVLIDDEQAARWIPLLLEAVQKVGTHTFLLSEKSWRSVELSRSHNVINLSLQVPPDQARQQIWAQIGTGYPVDESVDWAVVAGKFRFTIGQMERTLAVANDLALWQSPPREKIDLDTLHQACYGQIQHGLEKKATRITPKANWDKLILPHEQKEQLQNACNQMKFRTQVYGEWGFEQRLSYGKGLSMLFAGPPGTGKTMSAEVIAADLHLEIYKIDLSQVISKYIGETEKNLHEIFSEALLSSAILFFDEADALFGKRSEVKDAHDKYANVETAYLLQKMEEYEGITILATNFQQNLDDAFMRRLNYVIKFPFPDAEYREKIWRGMFPKQTPIDSDVDFSLLAEKFEIAGGNIKNVVLSSAFLAAQEGTKVGMKQIVRALQHELKKTGKLMPKKEFEDFFS